MDTHPRAGADLDRGRLHGAGRHPRRGLSYLLEGAGQEEIERAVRSVADGQVVYGAGVAERVMAFFSARSSSAVAPFPQLSERKREVLTPAAEGRVNADIARRLFLSD